MRRTSLPVISIQPVIPSMQALCIGGNTVDSALLSEAHGLVAEMLNDPHLPPTVLSGLQALHSLLSPTRDGRHSARNLRPTTHFSLSHESSGSDSDSDENPYTGEKPSVQKKMCRRGVAAHLLRRMSTSTWTTTTSATGMPTLEPQPSRRRATSFRAVSGYRDRPATYSHSPVRATTTTESLHTADQNDYKPKRYLGVGERKSRLHSFASHPQQVLGKNTDHRRMIFRSNSSEDFSSRESRIDENPAGSATSNADYVRRRFGPRNTTSDYESCSGSPCSSTEAGDEAMRQRIKIRFQECRRLEIEESTEELIRIDLIEDKNPVTTPESTSDQEEDDKTKRKFRLKDGSTYDLDALSENSLLNDIADWDYPIFDLADSSGVHLLSHLCFRVFSEVGLFETFRIPIKPFLNYFHSLEIGYRNIPYHNQIHAADVLQAVYYFTSQPIPGFEPPPDSALTIPEGSAISQIPCSNFPNKATYGILGAHLPALELMALYTAAAMHDYDHPGRTNAFLVTTNASQAVLYNDRSVLENHHAAAAWSLFLSSPKFNFLIHLDRAEFKRFRYLVIESILATDLKRHFEILAEFNAKANELNSPGIDWNAESDRLLAVQMSIKLADINGPCKELRLHRDWTYRIAEEFYEQGDEEERLGLPISPYMDRKNTQLAKLQESFINHLVAPLCNAYGQAGLLPGVWQDEDTLSNLSESSSEEEKDDDDYMSASSSNDSMGEPRSKASTKCRVRKIFCIHTQHIQENHHFWVGKIKEEQAAADEDDHHTTDNESPSVDHLAVNSEERPLTLSLSATDQPMESIEEEKTPASVSSPHSFSFEQDQSKI